VREKECSDDKNGRTLLVAGVSIGESGSGTKGSRNPGGGPIPGGGLIGKTRSRFVSGEASVEVWLEDLDDNDFIEDGECVEPTSSTLKFNDDDGFDVSFACPWSVLLLELVPSWTKLAVLPPDEDQQLASFYEMMFFRFSQNSYRLSIALVR